MKGFILEIGDETISGAVETGSSSVLLTYRNGVLRVVFNGMDTTETVRIWYAADLREGNSLTVRYGDIPEVSEARPVRDFNDRDAENRLLMESYERMKRELTDEGLIE